MKIKFIEDKTSKDLYRFTKISIGENSGVIASFPPDREQEIILPFKKIDKPSIRQFVLVIRQIIRTANLYKQPNIYIDLEEIVQKIGLVEYDENQIFYLMGLNFGLANYYFRKYLSKPKEGFFNLQEVMIISGANAKEKNLVAKGLQIAEISNEVRDLCNIRGAEMTPRNLVMATKKMIEGTKIKMTVYDDKKIAELKMGGIIAVGKGSAEPSRFIILEYFGKGKDAGKSIVLIGKGITFDTGGLDLKPSGMMNEMNYDMSGGANVIGAIVASAKLGLKKNIIAIIPAVENSISGSSYRPGDIVKMYNGKTVEIKNTDAEGRIVLADAISYSAKYKPAVVIDVATLTGASMVALGDRHSALFSFDEKLKNSLLEAGNYTGDYLWSLPLWQEHLGDVVGKHSDLANLHKSGSKYGGAIVGASFLAHFVPEDVPWAHIDMAPRMTVNENDNLEPGSSGEPMRALVDFIENF